MADERQEPAVMRPPPVHLAALPATVKGRVMFFCFRRKLGQDFGLGRPGNPAVAVEAKRKRPGRAPKPVALYNFPDPGGRAGRSDKISARDGLVLQQPDVPR